LACSREHHQVERPPTAPCLISAPQRGRSRRDDGGDDIAGVHTALGDGGLQAVRNAR